MPGDSAGSNQLGVARRVKVEQSKNFAESSGRRGLRDGAFRLSPYVIQIHHFAVEARRMLALVTYYFLLKVV